MQAPTTFSDGKLSKIIHTIMAHYNTQSKHSNKPILLIAINFQIAIVILIRGGNK